MDAKVKKEIEEIIALFESSNLSELEVEKDGMRICLKKGAPLSFSSSPGAVKEHAEQVKEIDEPAARQTNEVEENLVPIKSPMVGTFYSAPSPGSPAFIEIDDIIHFEQPVCIIEAMKLMNEIKSEIKGKVAKILVEDGHPVEYGQTLFLISPEE